MEFIVKHTEGGTTTNVNLISRATDSTITSAKLKQTIMQEDIVTIDVSSAQPLTIAIGDTLDVFGTTYTINQLPTIKRSGTGYTTTLTFEGLQYGLIDKLFLPPSEDGVRGDSMCFNLQKMVQMVVSNANRGKTGKPYTLAECPTDTEYKNITLSEVNCLKALQDIANQWSVEFCLKETATAIEIHVANKIGEAYTGYVFEYGKGGGVFDMQRSKPSEDIITRLYSYGGTDNLTYYRHTRLCLPTKDRWHSYIESADMVSRYGVREGVHNFDDIIPTFTGRVKAITDYKTFTFEQKTWNAATEAWEWTDVSFDLNAKWKTTDYTEWRTLRGLEDTTANRTIFANDVAGKQTKYLIAGTTATAHFQTGGLAGYDIDIEKADTTSVANTKITLSPLTDENGYEFPSKTASAFQMAVGDEFIILGINLPNEWKEEAEARLQSEATKYYNTHCVVQAAYTLQLEPLWLKRNLGSEVGDVTIFSAGDSIQILDIEGGVTTPTAIRINSYERDLIDVYSYRLTLSDNVELRAISRVVSSIAKIEKTLVMNDLTDPNTYRHNWNVKQEVLGAVFDTDGYFTDKIRPQSIETQMLAVGARSQQLTIANLVISPNVPNASNTPQPDVCKWSSGILNHFTINGDNTIRTWEIAAGSISSLATGVLYIYARCTKATGSTAATLSISATQRQYDADPTYYYFLIGTLSSVQDGIRDITLTYGLTTINGRNITTGVIQGGADKSLKIDLDNGTIKGNILLQSGGQDVSLDNYVTDLVGEVAEEEVEKAIGEDIDERIDAAVDEAIAALDITVGGPNYLTSETETITSGSDTFTWTYDDGWFVYSSTRGTGSDPRQHSYSNAQHKLTLEAGTYAITIWMQRAGSNSSIIRLYDDTKTSYYFSQSMRELTKVTKTFTLEAETNIGVIVKNYAIPYRLQIEKGSIATDWKPAQADIDATISAAQTAADAAQTTATQAQTAAATANATLADYANDSKIVATEKEGLKQQYNDIVNEKEEVVAQATKYGVATTAYLTAYTTAKTGLEYLCGISTGSPAWATTIDISSGAAKAHYDSIADYYTARQQILKLIATQAVDYTTAQQLAKTQAETAANAIQVGGRNYITSKSSITDFVCENGEWWTDSTPSSDSRSWSKYENTQHRTTLPSGKYLLTIETTQASNKTTCGIQLMDSTGATIGGISYQSSSTSGINVVGKKTWPFTLTASTDIGIIVKIYEGRYRIKVEQGTKATDWSPAIEDVDEGIANALSAAETAESNAQTAIANAKTATDALDKYNDDGYISPTEKTALKQQKADIENEYADIIKQAGEYSVATTAYTTAKTAAITALTKYTAAEPLHIEVGTDYANIAAYYVARQNILNAITTAAVTYVNTTANTEAKKVKDDLETQIQAQTTALGNLSTTLTTKIDGVQEQVDAKIDTWFYNYAPSLVNEPASKWNTSELKQAHKDDLFYNTATGYTYRWTGVTWTRIKDSDITSAMSAASSAQATADGKASVFYAQPTPPYSLGDMWVQGASGDILYCNHSRAAGASYTASDWVKASKYTDDTAALQAVQQEQTARTTAMTNLATQIGNDIEGLQTQIDGKIDTWFYAYTPTTGNAPANAWTTTEKKQEHIDDLFYDTSKGYTYRWTGTAWSRIKDSDITEAMAAASTAGQDKARVFTTTPKPPYAVGDMWLQGPTGDIMFCSTARSSGTFLQTDWTTASKYTDNSALEAYEDRLDTDEAALAAVRKTANAAMTELQDIADDDKLTPSEKGYLKQIIDEIDSENGELLKDIAAFETKGGSIDKSAGSYYAIYTAAFTAVVQMVQALLNETGTSDKPTYYDSRWSSFYAARENMWSYMASKGYQFSKDTATQSFADYHAQYGYLNDAIAGTTLMEGGLILTNVLGVGEYDASMTAEEMKAHIKAGLAAEGSDDSSVRMWAGSDTENRATAPFKVTQGGAVTMTKADIQSKNGNGGMQLVNGQLVITDKDGNTLTEILPNAPKTIQNMLDFGNLNDDTGSAALAEISISDSKSLRLGTYTAFSMSKSREVVLFTPQAGGKVTIGCSITSSSLNAVTDTWSPAEAQTHYDDGTLTIGKSPDSERTIAVDIYQGDALLGRGAGTYNIKADVAVKAVLHIDIYEDYRLVDRDIESATLGSYKVGAKASANVTYDASYNVHNNKFFADGILLSSAPEKYLAFMPPQPYGDNKMMEIRLNDFQMMLSNGRLYFKTGGSTMYNMTPLCLMFSIVKNNTRYDVRNAWDPIGKATTLSVTKTATGVYKVTHALGLDTSYMVQAITHQSTRVPMITDLQSTYFVITIDNSGGSHTDTDRIDVWVYNLYD